MKKVTLKDIAMRCGVTPTLVSAVLNHRSGNISCQEAKRKHIEQVARELGYRTNVLASAMASHRIPVVALMLHLVPESFGPRNNYFSTAASSLTMDLHQRHLETLLVFYRTQEEQRERFFELYGKSLIGGVVSDLIPRHNADFITELQRQNIPYVLWGKPDVPALSVRESRDYSFVAAYHQRWGTKRCYLMQEVLGHLVLYPYREQVDYYRFEVEPMPVSAELLADPENMIAVLGVEYFRECPYRIARPFILEQKGNERLIPPDVPYLLDSGDCKGITELTGTLIGNWMTEQKPPLIQEYRIPAHNTYEINWNMGQSQP